jgi:uncharacterized membrane-anchored protein
MSRLHGIRLFKCLVFCVGVVALSFGARVASAQEGGNQEFHPVLGPTWVMLGDQAQLSLPEGYASIPKNEIPRAMAKSHNSYDGELAFFGPTSEREDWFALVYYHDVGYVRDNERIDADEMLKAISQATEEGNRQRQLNGWNPMEVVGWSTPPHYDAVGNHLEYGILGASIMPDGTRKQSVNYHMKLLGREGFLDVTIVAGESGVESAVQQMRALANGIQFNPGKTYAEYRQGDKVAKYGLAGLILGGAAVAAAKSGLLTKLFKPLLLALGAAGVAMLRNIKRLFGRGGDSNNPSA